MTDMLISLNAGLLVLGILCATDKFGEELWRQLQRATAQAEQQAAGLQINTQILQFRIHALAGENEKAHEASTIENKPQTAGSSNSLVKD